VVSSAVILAGAMPAASRDAADFCGMTSQLAVRSCKLTSKAQNAVALGKCNNVADAAAREACVAQASTDFRDAVQTCRDEAAFREAACDRLGEAAYDPVIDPSNFVATIDNPYFPLVPGTTFVYDGQTAAGFEHVEFAVTHNVKTILGVPCAEVHDTVLLDGMLAEDTLDWFAQDRQGNVWYFGENTHEVADGLITTIHGSFVAGENGARPGIIMGANPAVGDFYRQEFDLENAEDFAEVVSLDATVSVAYGSFTGALDTLETTPLETDLHEHKFYAPGVGQVLTVDADTGDRVELVEIRTGL
jgi:hypothetical protein